MFFGKYEFLFIIAKILFFTKSTKEVVFGCLYYKPYFLQIFSDHNKMVKKIIKRLYFLIISQKLIIKFFFTHNTLQENMFLFFILFYLRKLTIKLL